MHSITNQGARHLSIDLREIQRFQECINNLNACAPLIIHVYPNKVITEVHPVYKKEIDQMVAIRDEYIKSYFPEILK